MDLFLIYINYIGKDHKLNHLYEFLFNDSIINLDGEEWDTYPASGRPEPPHEIFIKKAMLLRSELKLDVVQMSDTFAVWDAIDGIVALAWENVNDYEIYPDHRICFHFGDTFNKVTDKLYEKDLTFENEKQNTK